jgi:hypothetical protein
MSSLVPDDQSVKVGGQTRRLFLKQATSDPDVAQVSLRTAAATLKDALHDIGKLAKETEKPKKRKLRALDAPEPPVWSLALDEIRDTGVELRPRLPLDGPRDFTGPERVSRRTKLSAASVTLSQLLADVHVALDPLTVADDAAYLDGISRNTNVPEAIRDDLPSLY